MTKATRIAGVVLSGVFLVGCAHGPQRAAEADGLKTRVDSLESQVAALNQRLDEVAAGQPAAETAGVSSEQSAKPKTRLSVRQVQKALAAAGYYKGTVDGKSGPQTKKAIKEFQQAQGLKADGVVGSATSEALAKYL